jgi:hypothetical protein
MNMLTLPLTLDCKWFITKLAQKWPLSTIVAMTILQIDAIRKYFLHKVQENDLPPLRMHHLSKSLLTHITAKQLLPTMYVLMISTSLCLLNSLLHI